MKYITLLMLSLPIFFIQKSKAQSIDSIRIVVDDFLVKSEAISKVVGQNASIILSSEIKKRGNLLILEMDDVKRRIIKSWIRKNAPIIDSNDIDTTRWRVPNYTIDGEINNDLISVKVVRENTGETVYENYTVFKSKNPDAKYLRKIMSDFAIGIIDTLISSKNTFEPRTLLKIITNDPKVDLEIDQKKINISSNQDIVVKKGRNFAEIIASSTAEDFLDSKRIKLEDLYINRVKIKKSDEGYNIKRLRVSPQATIGTTVFSGTPALSLDFDLKYLIGKSMSLGAHFEWHNINYEYSFDTFSELNPIEQSDQLDLIALGLVFNYEQYQSPINIIWNAELNLNGYPNQGGGIKLGAALEKFPAIQLKAGYRILWDSEVEQAVFNQFGNATYETVEETFQGFYIGLSCNLWL